MNNDEMNDLNVGAHQNSIGTKQVHEESSDDNKVPTDSARVDFELNLAQELSTHAQGQATMGASLGNDETEEDIFASSSGDDCDGHVV